jgi:hypothetical protein
MVNFDTREQLGKTYDLSRQGLIRQGREKVIIRLLCRYGIFQEFASLFSAFLPSMKWVLISERAINGMQEIEYEIVPASPVRGDCEGNQLLIVVAS